MKYTFLALLAFTLVGILFLASCRCANRVGQSSESQPDIITVQQQPPDTSSGSSSAQQQTSDTSTGSSSTASLKADLRLVKGTTGESGVDITVEYSVNRKAQLKMLVRYPDNSVKELNFNGPFGPGKNQTVIRITPDKGKGQGSIKLNAEIPGGDTDSASVKYVISSYTPNTNVLWGDYNLVLPSH